MILQLIFLFLEVGSVKTWRITHPWRSHSHGRNTHPLFNQLEGENQAKIDPEVFLCGEPRLPPSPLFLTLDENPIWMLKWARNDLLFPRNSWERERVVFPMFNREIQTTESRLASDVTLPKLLSEASASIENITSYKSFLLANLDLVSPSILSQAIVMAKLSARFTNRSQELVQLERLFHHHRAAIDSLTFPLHIELLKAETRVATYLFRKELSQQIDKWDVAEVNCYFLVLLAARLKWSLFSEEQEEYVEEKGESTPLLFRYEEKMSLRKSFLRSKLTAVVYQQASDRFAEEFPQASRKLLPELKFVADSFSIPPDDLASYAIDLCSKHGIDYSLFKRRLLSLSNFLDSVSLSSDFKVLPQYLLDLYLLLATEPEVSSFQRWFRPQDFDFQPFFLDNDESVGTFNALERLFSENLLDLPIDLTTFRGFPNPRLLFQTGSLASETRDWLSADPSASPSSSETESSDSIDNSDSDSSSQRDQDLSFVAAFLAQLEEGRRECSHYSVNRSLLLEHEATLRDFQRTAFSLVDP